MQYPMFKSYLETETDENGDLIVTDDFQGQSYTVPQAFYSFAVQLTGDRDPDTIPGYTAQERRRMLRQLKQAKLVRQTRVLEKHFGSVYYTLLYGRLNERLEGIAKPWNFLLSVLFLPMLLIGLFCYLKSDVTFEGSMWGGIFIGFLTGGALHEFSHGAACVAYGGTLHEIGVMVQNFLPGAYVLIKPKEIRGRLKRVQLYAAGVEMNFLLGGVYFLLASVLPFDGFFFAAGYQNVFLGVLNLCFITVLDGSRIIGELIGSADFVFDIWNYLFHQSTRRKLLQRPYGAAVLFASAVLLIAQLALPLLIIDNFIGLIEVFV